jgi:hypothetical protein
MVRGGSGKRRAGSAVDESGEIVLTRSNTKESESELETPLALETKRKHRLPKYAGAPVEVDGNESLLSDAVAKRARMDDQGRIVSKAAVHWCAIMSWGMSPDVHKSTCHKTHNPGILAGNTRLWCGQSLELGQAFKLTVWNHYGLQMPVEKSRCLPQHTALFRTAAYYAFSLDGVEEQECIKHKDFPDFVFILVQAAKQMRYNILIKGRIFLGENVFTTFRPAKKYQGEFRNVKYTKIS